MDSTRHLYQQLLDASTNAFELRAFPSAYHALAGAMHCAYTLQDGPLLTEIETLAEEQGTALAEYSLPEVEPQAGPAELSQSTLLALYHSLARLANTRRAFLQKSSG